MPKQKNDEVTPLAAQLIAGFGDNTKGISKELKGLVSKKVRGIKQKKRLEYDDIALNCSTTTARISDVSNNNIDCQLTTIIDIAIGLRVHPKVLFEIDFDFDQLYVYLDDIHKEKREGQSELKMED